MFSQSVILYHADCIDGFTSAWVARKKLSNTDIVPVKYGDPFPNGLDGCVVYVLDFSYPRDVLDKLMSIAKTVIILDHHKTAVENLKDVPKIDWNFTTEPDDLRGAHALFDMSKSGARLSWEYFLPEARPNRLVKYVEDYDLWNFSMEHTREIHEYLEIHNQDIDTWDKLSHEMEWDFSKVVWVGDLLLTAKMSQVGQLTKGARISEMRWGPNNSPCKVAVVPAPYSLTSFTGEELIKQGFPIALLWRSSGEFIEVSLRSEKGGDYDVSAIAKRYGGGGHASAAGFRIPRSDLYNWVDLLL